VNADGEGMDIDGGEAAVPKVTTFGRIIRDEDGNVIDIIIDEPEDKDEEEEQGRWKPLNEAEDKEVETVEAKTEVVKGESSSECQDVLQLDLHLAVWVQFADSL